VQIQRFESPSVLPTLEALDAEFECEDEKSTAARRREGGAPMDHTLRSTQPEFADHPRAAMPSLDAMKGSPVVQPKRPSLAKRALRRLASLLIIFCAGLSTTLAWQSYGDAARARIANSSPQLAWLGPQTAPVALTAPDPVAPAAATSSDMQRLALGLAAVRQTVDQLATQFAAGQQQTSGDITKVQADEQEILRKLSANPPRPAAAPAHKLAPVTPPPSPSSPSAQAR
jgi:hypothetical protein